MALRHAWIGMLLVLVGCGGMSATQTSRCLNLAVPDGNDAVSVALPARVSLFFGIDTCEGKPVAGLGSDAFEVLEDGRPLSVLESKRAIRAKGQKYRMASVLLLDLSGSILRNGDFPQLKEAAARYVKAVLNSHDSGQRLAIFTFDGREQPDTLINFTDDSAAALRALDALEQRECSVSADCAGFLDRRSCAGWRCVDDSTNLNGAVVKALDVLDDAIGSEKVAWKESALVVFTDGSDQASRLSTSEMLQRAERSPAHRFTVGLGAEIDSNSLKALGRDGSWPVVKASALAEAFDSVAERVTSRANRFYLLEYCSPKRSGQHTVKVVARWSPSSGETLVGGLSRNFDATGFSSGCELVE